MNSSFKIKAARRIIAAALLITTVTLTAVILLSVTDNKLYPTAYKAPTMPLTNFTYEIDGKIGTVTLPHKFEKLTPRTAVILETEISSGPRTSLLVKTVYAPLRLYADNKLIYECGQEGSYPAFLLDPPTIITTISLPDIDGIQRLRFEYLSPTQRSRLELPVVLAGDEVALIVRMFELNGFSLLFSLILLITGISIVMIAIIIRDIPASSQFLWLGLFAASTGIWILGECDLTAFLIPYSSLLYVMAYMGMFTLTLPFLRYGLLTLNPRNKLPIYIMEVVIGISILGASLLQLTGRMAFTRSLYLFHIIIPLAFIVFTFCIAWEYYRYHNPAARRFALPMLVQIACGLLELINYQIRFTDIISLFFQIGTFFFIFSLSIIGGHFTHEAMRTAEEKVLLEMEVSSMSRQLALQSEQYEAIAENTKAMKMQRHDIRHHLAVVKGFINTGDTLRLNNYLDKLVKNIPAYSDKILCENFAVNAVAMHYLSMAEELGIESSIQLLIPEKPGKVQDSDICIIIGNLLENAIEACKRMDSGNRFIKMNTYIQYTTLVITMDNSFDGNIDERDGVFYSNKHRGEGVGLSSIRFVAKKYGGSAKFEFKDNVFLSSIYIEMGNTEAAIERSPLS